MKSYLQILIVTSFILLGSTGSNAQTITTLAGIGGWSWYSGDGGPATAAAVPAPGGLATDAFGNTYISSDIYTGYNAHKVRVIDASGHISLFAGSGIQGFGGDGGPATDALMNYPTDIAHDAFGNLYILDFENYRIRKVNAAGIISTVAGIGVNDYMGDGGPAIEAAINAPYGLACDRSGNIYFSQFNAHAIRKISATGVITTFAGNTTAGFSGDGGPATAAQIGVVYGIAADKSGNIYIADYTNYRIRKINTSGIITTVAGNGIGGFSGDGGPATAASFNGPNYLTIDTAGNIDISDFYNHRVRQINTVGIINTIAGNGIYGYSGDGGAATAAKLSYCMGLAVNNLNNVIVADQDNNRVRSIKVPGPVLYFTGGHYQNVVLCVNESQLHAPVNTILAVEDSTTGSTDNWSVVTPPLHGTLVATYSTTSTGGILTPSGLTYTPNSGYLGADTFKAAVTNGMNTDYTVICVSINPVPESGIVSGKNSICPGQLDTLTETAIGGYWGLTNTAIAHISSTGLVTGLLPGLDTIVYTDTNFCGTARSYFPIVIKPYSLCHTGIGFIANPTDKVTIYPDPVHDELTISSENTIINVVITNLAGQLIYEQKGISDLIKVDVRNYPQGVYFIKINNTNIRKFVKE